LISDRFSAYKKLPTEISKAYCWVHVRRDFLKIFQGLAKHRNWARQWLLDIANLFVLNHKRFKLWQSGETLSKAWANVNSELHVHTENMQKNFMQQLEKGCEPQQRTVLHSLRKHWTGLTLFLSDPRIPLDNNRAERLLRGCVIQRKNSYGNAAEWSGDLSASMFSIIQTWLANNLDPEHMLRAYFHECSLHPGQPPPSIDKFLPWKMSNEQKHNFSLPKSFKKPG
jgi:transposase